MDHCFYNNPPRYDDVVKAIANIKVRCPDLKIFCTGKSVLKRKIPALGIGNLKNATLFVGTFYAQEWLTSLLILRFLEDLCCHYQSDTTFMGINIRKSLLQRGLICVPVVNPDGLEILMGGTHTAGRYEDSVVHAMEGSPSPWQDNARGVDLFYNFDTDYEKVKHCAKVHGSKPSSQLFYGCHFAHSEPETKSLVSLCSSFPLKKVMSFCSHGEEIVYRYGKNAPLISKFVGDILSSSCGYSLFHRSEDTSYGDFCDWFIKKYSGLAFAIKIGRGENPLPIIELEPIYARLVEMMLISVFI
ncbi:MAG: peptidase carboxypeptidase [Oscillospiraceae bacterium]|nr:peptidase carboxypeptidase [Oscillospiraceae bacterium]